MAINPFIKFDGKCMEAVKFYSDVFNSPLQRILTFGDMAKDQEVEITEETKDLVVFTFLEICGTKVMFSDTSLDDICNIGNNISLSVMTETPEQTKEYFEKLKEGAKIFMDLQETFFSKSYAHLEDKFGVIWQLNCEKSH